MEKCEYTVVIGCSAAAQLAGFFVKIVCILVCRYAVKIIKKSILLRVRQRGGNLLVAVTGADSTSVSPATDSLRGVLREIAIMKKLHHPNVVVLHEVIDVPNHNKRACNFI
jgi:hypothetical protein